MIMRSKAILILTFFIAVSVNIHQKVFADASSGYLTFEQLVNSEVKKNEKVCSGKIIFSSQYDSLDIKVIYSLTSNVERTITTWYLVKIEKCIVGTESDSIYVFITNLNYGRTRYLFDEKEYMLPILERDSTYLFFLNSDDFASKKFSKKIFISDVIISKAGSNSAITIIEKTNEKKEMR